MTASTAQTEPAKRRRRRTPAVLAVLFLLIGAGLLWYSFFWQTPRGQTSAAPGPSATWSPTAVLVTAPMVTLPPPASPTPGGSAAPTPRPSATEGTPQVSVSTSYVYVQTSVNASVSGTQDSGLLALVTTVSGLLASLAGIVSALLSFRVNRSLPR